MHLLRYGAINRIAFDRVCALRPTLPLVKRFTVPFSLPPLLFYLVPCPFAFWASSGDLNGMEVDLDAHYACRNSNCWTRFIKDQPTPSSPSRRFLVLPSISLILRCLFFAFHGWRMLAKATRRRREGEMREKENGTCCSMLFSTLLIIRYEGLFAVHSRSARAHVQCAAITPVQKSVLFHRNRWNSPVRVSLIKSCGFKRKCNIHISIYVSFSVLFKAASRLSKQEYERSQTNITQWTRDIKNNFS